MEAAAFALVAGLTGGLCALGLALGRWRHGAALALALLIASAALAWRLGALGASPAVLAEWPWSSLGLAAGWLLVGAAARRCGGLVLGPNLGLAALLGGALLGDVAAAGLIAAQVGDPRRAARAALVASAGAMLSGIGTPATLLVAGPASLWPLALACAAVAWPRGARRPAAGSAALTAGLAAAALLSWWRPALGLAAAAAALLAAGARPRLSGRDGLALVHLAAAAGLAWLAWRSGALWITEWGLSWAAADLHGAGALPALLGWLAAALGGEPAAAVVLGTLADAPLSPAWPGLRVALGAGLATGGLGPLLACGHLRDGWWIWLIQGGLAAAWSALWLARALPWVS